MSTPSVPAASGALPAAVPVAGSTHTDTDTAAWRLAWLALAASGPGRRVLRSLGDCPPGDRPAGSDGAEDFRNRLTAAWHCGVWPPERPARHDHIDLPASASRQCVEALPRLGQRLLLPVDPDYPPLLRELPGAPLTLFTSRQGRLPPTSADAPGPLAIVGSRRASRPAVALTRGWAEALAEVGVHIVSGLAYGIDAAAHEGALAAGDHGAGTTAVLAGGLDQVGPRGNLGLAAAIVRQPIGALVSEHRPGVRPIPAWFPERNRIIAGLCRAVLVVEAAARSGALITARLAGDAGRDVLAVPGAVVNPLAAGCHALLRDGAVLVRDVEDVLEALGRPGPQHTHPTVGLSAEAILLLERLAGEALQETALQAVVGLSPAALRTVLTELEIQGRVQLVAGRWTRIA